MLPPKTTIVILRSGSSESHKIGYKRAPSKACAQKESPGHEAAKAQETVAAEKTLAVKSRHAIAKSATDDQKLSLVPTGSLTCLAFHSVFEPRTEACALV